MEGTKYADKHEEVFIATETTVDEWFEFWIENIVGDLAPNTIRNYRERYIRNIQPVIGKTYVTHAIESGMQPKVLQKLLGHASIQTAMDRYVHVTDEAMDQAVKQFEKNGVSA